MELIKLFLVIFIIKSVSAGGDDPCAYPGISFNQSAVLSSLHKIELLLKYMNETTIQRINDSLSYPDRPLNDHLAIQISNLETGGDYFQTIGLNITLVENAINYTSSFINFTFASEKAKNIAITKNIVTRMLQYLDQVLNNAWDLIAPKVDLDVECLLEEIEMPISAVDFPLSCIIVDVKYLRTLKEAVAVSIGKFGNETLAAINESQ